MLLRLVVARERGGRAAAAFAPHLGQPLGRLDRLRARDHRREVAIQHLEIHAVLRDGVGREERLELVELGFGEGFVEGAGIGHGRLGSVGDASEPCMIPRPARRRNHDRRRRLRGTRQ